MNLYYIIYLKNLDILYAISNKLLKINKFFFAFAILIYILFLYIYTRSFNIIIFFSIINIMLMLISENNIQKITYINFFFSTIKKIK